VVCCCRRACGKWLPKNHLAHVVSDVIDQLDLSAMDEVYGSEKRSQPPYDPRMITKLLVYGYCVGVFSSRRLTLLRGGVSQGSGTGLTASSFSICRLRLRQQILICERRTFPSSSSPSVIN
jgi:transposase